MVGTTLDCLSNNLDLNSGCLQFFWFLPLKCLSNLSLFRSAPETLIPTPFPIHRLYSHCVLLFPPCLRWVMPSQLSDLNLSIIFREKLFLTTSHSPHPSYSTFTPPPLVTELWGLSYHLLPLFRVPFTTAILYFFMSLLNSCFCFLIRLQTIWGQETHLFLLPIVSSLSSLGPGSGRLSILFVG